MTTSSGFAVFGRALALSVLLGMASQASAADGRIAINQSKAQAGKITPGDAAGFPVTLTRSGSYLLTSNLTISDNQDGIVIAANGVTIDLNGFRITGTGLGTGIHDNNVSRKGITIRNGTISNFNLAVRIFASTENVVQGMRTFDNYDGGMGVGSNSLVSGNIVSDSGYVGIVVGDYSLVTGNIASGFATEGITVHCPSSVIGNTARTTINLTFEGCTAANNSPAP
jgi:parallel beta-helix repeat protein